tara:strand:+ start:237 stop:863 length:627 start_codon:yes stop_codon:yes gene_type:complete
MAIVINGSGTVTGLAVGGLPDGTVDSGTLATNSVDSAELIDGAIDAAHLASGVGGKLLQVVEANGTTHTGASTTNNTWTATVVTAAITPASTSNKIFVCYRLAVHFVDSSGDAGYGLRCKRAVSGGSTVYPAELSTWSSGNVHTVFFIAANTNSDFNANSTTTGVDSPSTTSAVTYTVEVAGYNVNNTLEAGGQYSGRWSMVLMEIEG